VEAVEQRCTSSLTIALKSKAPKSIKNENKHAYLMFFGRRKKNCDEDYVSLKRLLVSAAESGDLAKVKRLVVDCGIDPNIQDDSGETPLHYAAGGGHPDVVKLLLERGADPNVKDYNGRTPLHIAAENCHVHEVKVLLVDVARVLLDYGADPTIRDNKGRTPLDYGSNCGEFIKELRRRSGGTMVYK